MARRPERAFVPLLAAAAALWTSPSQAQLYPWHQAGDIPLPPSPLSARASQDDLPLYQFPTKRAKRRGSVKHATLLPVYGAVRKPGCKRRWLLVGPSAWTCLSYVELKRQKPLSPFAVWPDAPDGMPFRYFFVGQNGSAGYGRLNLVDNAVPDQELQPGFALAIVKQVTHFGERYGRTHHGLWVPMRDLGPVRPNLFTGENVVKGKLDMGWVVVSKAYVFTRPGGMRTQKGKKFFTRFELIHYEKAQKRGRHTFYRIGEKRWLSSKDVRAPSLASPPAQLKPNERWIDVHLKSQTVVAYRGKTPVFATITSTGKGRQGTAFQTPKGVHRVWVKLRSSNMDNLENEYASRNYAIEDVPYVQYFSKGVGLHGAFWHHSFGHVHSHGCVNLTPLDAQRLFHFTSPHLPAGWTAALPTAREPGTIIRVRLEPREPDERRVSGSLTALLGHCYQPEQRYRRRGSCWYPDTPSP